MVTIIEIVQDPFKLAGVVFFAAMLFLWVVMLLDPFADDD